MVVRKYKFTNKEILELTEQLDGYIWVVMDVKKGVIAAGDEYVSDLRDELLISRHSKANDIFGAGLNMRTGEIDYIPAVNRRNPSLDRGELSSEQELRVETVLHYFSRIFRHFWLSAPVRAIVRNLSKWVSNLWRNKCNYYKL